MSAASPVERDPCHRDQKRAQDGHDENDVGCEGQQAEGWFFGALLGEPSVFSEDDERQSLSETSVHWFNVAY